MPRYPKSQRRNKKRINRAGLRGKNKTLPPPILTGLYADAIAREMGSILLTPLVRRIIETSDQEPPAGDQEY